MKVQSIQCGNYTNKSITKNNNQGSLLSISITDQKSFNPSFGILVKQGKMKILERSYEEMIDLAEYMHNMADEYLREYSKIYALGGTLAPFLEKPEASIRAYAKLKPFINIVNRVKATASKEEIKRLNDKASRFHEIFDQDEPDHSIWKA